MGFIEHFIGVKYTNISRMNVKHLRNKKKVKSLRKKKYIQKFTFKI